MTTRVLAALLLLSLTLTACEAFGLASRSEDGCTEQARAYSGTLVASFVTTVGGLRSLTPGTAPVRWPELPPDSPAFLCYIDAAIAKAPPPGPDNEISDPFDRAVIGIAGGEPHMIVAGYRANLPVRAP